MKKELQQQLIEKYPYLYQNVNKDITQSCMAWGFDVNLNREGEQAFFWVHCSCQKRLFEQNSEVK